MTPKEAIECLKNEKLCILIADKNECTRECSKCDLVMETDTLLTAYDMAIEALEKQIPKKPIIYTDTRNLLDYNGNDYGVREVDVYDCPNCGFDISDKSVCEEYEYKPSCCPECGQKLNWEDWSEEE